MDEDVSRAWRRSATTSLAPATGRRLAGVCREGRTAGCGLRGVGSRRSGDNLTSEDEPEGVSSPRGRIAGRVPSPALRRARDGGVAGASAGASRPSRSVGSSMPGDRAGDLAVSRTAAVRTAPSVPADSRSLSTETSSEAPSTISEADAKRGAIRGCTVGAVPRARTARLLKNPAITAPVPDSAGAVWRSLPGCPPHSSHRHAPEHRLRAASALPGH